jgi:hypothetical protein
VLAIIHAAIFGIPYRIDEKEREYRAEHDQRDVSDALLAGFILSLVTLPLPALACGCCRSIIMTEEE